MPTAVLPINLLFAQARTGQPVQLVFGRRSTGVTPPPQEAQAQQLICATVQHRCQNARAAAGTATHRLQQTLQAGLTAVHRQQQASPAGVSVQYRSRDALRRFAFAQTRWQDAQRIGGRTAIQRSQTARRLYALAHSIWQNALQRRNGSHVRWQNCLRPIVTLSQNGQDAQWAARTLILTSSGALPVYLLPGIRWQDALRAWGGNYTPPPPLPPQPCWQPNANGHVPLLFVDAYSNQLPAQLVFRCRGKRSLVTPQQPALLVIPILRSYIMINSVTMHRAHDNTELPLLGFGMRLDRESWTWSFTATLPGAARALVQDAAAPKPLRVTAGVNGQSIELVIERVSRSQSFDDDTMEVQGRGLSALLAAPYAPVRSHGNAADRTAMQLATEVLTNNGVGIGWSVDWFLTDWLVPGGAWIQRGSYIDALNDIAAAVGGYVQPHDTAQRVQLLPAYPAAPWDWSNSTPDIELPIDATELVETAWLVQPDYNRIFVSGVSAGRLGRVTRQGTAGGKPMPMVTHPLITADAAVRQRGLAELGSMGRKTLRTLRMPVFSGTGIIKPGKLLRYTDEAGTAHTGISRAVSIDADNMPVLTQTLDVEFHGGF